MATESRIDPSQLSAEELRALGIMVAPGERPALVGKDGTRLELPEPVFNLLSDVVRMMQRRQSIVLIPEDETFTTQAAANHLGMSRQYFVTLLESGQIPFHRVGSHRRIAFKDLRDYEIKRDAERRSRLGGLFKRLQTEGHYDTDYVGADDAQ
jgi:excisionase family DNA binding protein